VGNNRKNQRTQWDVELGEDKAQESQKIGTKGPEIARSGWGREKKKKRLPKAHWGHVAEKRS